MTLHEIWLICFSIATPIAGLVAFTVQVRTVRKTRLENEKLQLELDKLRKEKKERERSIRVASGDETERYGQPMFSRRFPGACPSPEAVSRQGLLSSVLSAAAIVLVLFAGVAFVTYLGFDIYRLVRWVISFI